MRFVPKLIRLSILLLTFAGAGSGAAAEMPQQTFDGLALVNDSEFSAVYVDPDASFAQYGRINLDDAYIAFKKNWQQRQNRSAANRVSSNDMDKIRVELMLLFRDVFTRTLEEKGYELTNDIAEDVLLIKPAIINLDIVSPAISPADGNSLSFSQSAGEMTLYLELYDSVSGDIIARAADRKRDRQSGYFLWQNGISNRAAARRIVQVWAGALANGLDRARRGTPVE